MEEISEVEIKNRRNIVKRLIEAINNSDNVIYKTPKIDWEELEHIALEDDIR
jgi:hypothetical protein